MATLIRNKIKFEPIKKYGSIFKQLNDIKEYLKGDCGAIDFTKIVPIPEGMDLNTIEGDNWLLDNWGVRTAPTHCYWINDDELFFDTELYPAVKIAMQIAKDNPTVPFIYKYASEDAGKVAGESVSINDELIVFPKKSMTKDAFDISIELFPSQANLYVFNPTLGNYVYDTSDITYMVETYGRYSDCDGVEVEPVTVASRPNNDDLPF